MPDCRNCGGELHGRFCHQCGQKSVASQVSVHDFLHEAADELAHLDGKIFQTLKLLLLKPGSLTVEHLQGRRARYVSPLRLYLTCSLLFFALSAMTPDPFDFNVKITGVATARDQQIAERAIEAMRDLRDRILHYAPRAMFLLMPVFALLTWLVYRSKQPFYLAHLYYALHVHAFMFATMAIVELTSFFGNAGRTVGGLVPLTIVPYHYIALKRTFGGSRLAVAWKGTLVAAVYALTVGAILAALLAATIKSVVRS